MAAPARRLIGALIVGVSLWFVASQVIVPSAITRAYNQEAPQALNAMITDQDVHPLDDYLQKWNRLSWQLLPVLLTTIAIACAPAIHHRAWFVAVFLLVAAQVRVPGIVHRSIWDDEGITLLVTSGHAMPAWPSDPVPAGSVQGLFRGTASIGHITQELRDTDVHPPVYFWILSLWRHALGFSVEVARALSALCSLAAIALFYLTLRVARVEAPLFATAIYALSPAAMFWGGVARPYGLASLFMASATLFACLAASEIASRRRAIYAALAAVSCGVAFQTNYLTLFPSAIILLWLSAQLWPLRRGLAFVPPILAAAVGAMGISALWQQLGARPTQGAGFYGWNDELLNLLAINLKLLFYPYLPRSGTVAFYAVPAALLFAAVFAYILKHPPAGNRRIWLLLGALATAPSVGLVVLNVLFDKHLHYDQYVLYAAPALAAFVAYPIAHMAFSRPLVSAGVFAAVVAVQIAGVNWGFEEDPGVETPSRSLARTINERGARSVVLIDEGHGRSSPASLVYELDPNTPVAVFGKRTTVDALVASLSRYDDVWIRFSTDYPPNPVRDRLLNALEQSACFRDVGYERRTLHLERLTTCEAEGWMSRRQMADDFEALSR
jgi:hypothetical protein